MLLYNAVVLPSVTQQVVIRAAAAAGGAVVLVVVLVAMCIWIHSVTADISPNDRIHRSTTACTCACCVCLPASLLACLPVCLQACLKQPACLSLALPIVGGASAFSVHLVYLSGSVSLLLADLLSACICLVLCQPAPACQPAKVYVSLLHAYMPACP